MTNASPRTQQPPYQQRRRGDACAAARVGLWEQICSSCALRPVARNCNYRFPRRSVRTRLVPDGIGRAQMWRKRMVAFF